MSLILYYHPLASFCWKPLIALYENETPFIPHLIDLGSEESREDLLKVWPMGEFPVLRDEKKKHIVPQSAIIIEYVSLHYPGKVNLIPFDPELALETRQWDQFYDSYLQIPIQKIVSDIFRPVGKNDPIGVEEAHASLLPAYDVLEKRMKEKMWSVGETFTMADCSAAPALFYANKVEPFENTHPILAQYLDRLNQRASFARVLEEAKPYFHLFPYKGKTTS